MSDLQNSDLVKLFEAVHDQVASDREIAALDSWLRNNPIGQRQYLEFIDTQHEIERQVAGISRPAETIDPVSTVAIQPSVGLIKLLAIAASTLVVAGIGWWLSRGAMERSLVNRSPSSRGTNVLGIVTASDRAIGYFGRQRLESGSAVREGKVRLSSGKLRLRLESGVDLLLSDETEIELKDHQHVELIAGSVTADVPESVIGFSVEVPGLSVVDLGTTFGVSLPPGGHPQVHVFDGAVDAEIESSAERTRLTNKQTVTFDGASVSQTPFSDSLFVKPADQTHQSPRTTGDVRFLHTPPGSVERGRFEHDLVLCFREREESVLLQKDLSVSLDLPGHYRVKPKWKNFGRVPAGSLVDSYYIHLDSVEPEERRREGSITFAQPILGVVFSSLLLAEQDELLGHPETTYPTERARKKHDPTLENETVTLSADRRTIRFSWRIRSRTDQVRVLVAAHQPHADVAVYERTDVDTRLFRLRRHQGLSFISFFSLPDLARH